MPIARIAIVGRPNVGKSSLLNMLARERVAIVDDVAGVTRDRVAVVVELEPPARSDRPNAPPKPVEIVDTGGFGVYVAAGQRYDEVGNDLTRLTGDIERQIGEAVSSADLILFAVDCQAGITPQDERIAQLLREQRLGAGAGSPRAGASVPVRVVATKCDGPKWEPHAYELAALGFGEPLACSATSKYFRRDLLDRLYELAPDAGPSDERIESADLRLAIIGKRNVGKSTLINALAGERRVIVSEIPGTTRDAVDVRFDLDGRSVVAIDTAGLRRRKSFQGRIEHFAFDRAQRAIRRADVVLLVIDASTRISQVDEHLAQIVQRSFKPCIIVVNKWDLVEHRRARDGRAVTPEHYERYAREDLKGLGFAPIAIMSAAEGLNIRETVGLAFELHEQASARVGTGRLNRLVGSILERRGPSSKLGTVARVYYVAQVASNPPTIAMVVNRPELFTPNYRRYLLNRLREELPFEEVPIRLIIRGRSRRDHERDKREPRAPARAGGRPGQPVEFDLGSDAPAELRDEDLLEMMPDEAASYFDE